MINKFIFIDTETTGTHPETNGMIQMAGSIIYQEQGTDIYTPREVFDYKVKTFAADIIEDEALLVNGITREQIAQFPEPTVVYNNFIALLGKYCDKYNKTDKFFFVGYNARFDMDVIRAWFKKCGDGYFGSWFYFPPIDVMNLAIMKLIDERHKLLNFKLQTVADYLKINHSGHYHDALADIEVTFNMFLKLRGINQ